MVFIFNPLLRSLSFFQILFFKQISRPAVYSKGKTNLAKLINDTFSNCATLDHFAQAILIMWSLYNIIADYIEKYIARGMLNIMATSKDASRRMRCHACPKQ